MRTIMHMYELTTQYATISFFCFLLYIINCHIIRASIVHSNCKQPIYIPLQQTWLNCPTYGFPFLISYSAEVQDFLLVSSITINEVCGDYHVVQVLYGGPNICCHTNSLPNKSLSKNVHLTRINPHTSPYNSSAMGNRKPRLNYFHKFFKTLMLHISKR